jgi:hypothetical protein
MAVIASWSMDARRLHLAVVPVPVPSSDFSPSNNSTIMTMRMTTIVEPDLEPQAQFSEGEVCTSTYTTWCASQVGRFYEKQRKV